MPSIIPFKATRATPAKAPHLISRTYQDYDMDELEAQLKYNPYSFLQILNPGYKFSHDISGNERFNLVRNRFLEFKEERHLITEDTSCFYIYENVDPHHSYTGIIAGANTLDYENNHIKRHENTLHHKEVLFKDYLNTVGFNAEPVLLTYKDDDSLNEIIANIKTTTPDYHFMTTDHNCHQVWKVADEHTIDTIQNIFSQKKNLYIADGHHRTASSHLLAQEMGSKHDSYNYFMSFLIAESQLNIYEFNRLVKDLNGLSKEQFLMQLDQHFRIQNRGLEIYKPSKKHHFSMYLDGEFYSLYLRKDGHEIKTPLDDLDTQMLYDLVLKPLLGIGDLRTDSRIDYSYGKSDLLLMKDRIDRGKFEVGFGLFPATVDQMKSIADADLTMPPKSTYIRPKLPSGLIIYEFENE
ncbi:DUF1015 domain-containing protein [Nonlabens ponticola]|uniref:DUF1015 domain-containing protein n=1 Tax=Nonlabens ponticola TaxID=2496866 RepID=A0A3S9MYB1_9FLAO|nr:DUF1015 domain-containing protein [Nonlabens ponticola]AZQ44132.1 DUF1015 domain-containing protein [Nonlabens ponticola]